MGNQLLSMLNTLQTFQLQSAMMTAILPSIVSGVAPVNNNASTQQGACVNNPITVPVGTVIDGIALAKGVKALSHNLWYTA